MASSLAPIEDKYEFLGRLGAGGMGAIYKARHRLLDELRVIKVMRSSLEDNEELKTRFLHEAQAAARLRHSNIVQIYDFAIEEGLAYIAMEFIEGTTLRDLLATQSPPDVGLTLEIGLQSLEALSYLHLQKFVHRDISPDNLMLESDSEERVQIKLIDLGLAKRLETQTELTQDGAFLGKFRYASPEQFDSGTIDARSDIYSFGIVLYQLLTGRYPILGDDQASLVAGHLVHPPLDFADSDPDGHVPPQLRAAVLKAIAKKPTERFQTAEEFAGELGEIQLQHSGTVGLETTWRAARVASAPLLDEGTKTTPLPRHLPDSHPASETEPTHRMSSTPIPATVVDSHSVTGGANPGMKKLWGMAIVVVAMLALAAGYWLRQEAQPPPRIVVLPFENLGSSDHQYFAAGMTDEITSRLAAASGLGVISRKSALRYADTDKTFQQIGEELDVAYALEGTVRWASGAEDNRVRITPQLIRIADDTHIWVDTYDRVIDDFFDAQTDIAEKVIEQLGITLLEPERVAVETKPTENIEAYQAYHRGKGYSSPERPLAEQMFRRAVELDPGFVAAWAELSRVQALMYHAGDDRSPELKANAKRAADRAVALAPDSPEAHLAKGYYHYYVHKHYEQARAEFAIAAKGRPNDSETLAAMAYVERRQGRWEESLHNLDKALRLSPLDADLHLNQGISYLRLRRHEEASHHFNRGIAIAPDDTFPFDLKAMNLWRWKGTTAEARATLETKPGTSEATGMWWLQEIFEGKYQEAADRLSATPDETIALPLHARFSAPKALYAATVYDLLGEEERARKDFDAARVLLEEESRQAPEDFGSHSKLGLAYAGLGRKADAIREGKRAVELYPVSKDAAWGPILVEELALIYTMVGEHDAAVDQLEYLLSIPSLISIPLLRLDPRWAPLRQNPRFQELLRARE